MHLTENIENNKASQNVSTLKKQFIDELEDSGKSSNTLKNYLTDLDCFQDYLQEKTKSQDISKFGLPEVLEYGKYLQIKYTSDNSRRRRVQTLRSFFDFLIKEGIFSDNPVKKIPVSPKFVDIPRPTNLCELKTLWAYLLRSEQENPNSLTSLIFKRNQIIVSLIFLTGTKVSDLASLKVEHLLMASEPRLLLTPPKRDPYTVPLPEWIKNVVQEYLAQLEIYKRKAGIEFDELFFNANPYQIISGGLSARGLELIFEDWRKKLVINITPKSLRQSCIFNWLHQGMSESLIKEWLNFAPSYSLKPYKDLMNKNIFNSEFMQEFLDIPLSYQ